MWRYRQSTGELFAADGSIAGRGYAGNGAGKNNPALEQEHNVGPLPHGIYDIGPAYQHPTKGPVVMNLNPQPGTDTYGRDLFRMHGDSKSAPGNASLGCIVMPRAVRERVAAARGPLEVFA